MSQLSSKLLFVFIILLFICGVNTILVPYSINTWLVYFGKEPVVVWWHGVIIGIIPVIGEATIPFAFLTWLLMLFLV